MSLLVLLAVKQVMATFAGCPVFWPNEQIILPVSGDPPAPQPFVWVDIASLGSALIGLSSDSLGRQDGYLRCHIMVPYGQGLDQAYALASQISALFRAVSPLPGLQFFQPTAPEPGAQSDDGAYFGISFSISFSVWITN